ncbi:MAG TPA: hypothetical protein VJZ27_04630 [Aggregatilineales bacterium]|nr:hypothetical protein [Aggregatilineales bacterium]
MAVNKQDILLLSAYIDGELNESERLTLESRLQIDDELREEYDSLRQIVDLVRAMPMLKAPRNYMLDVSQFQPPAKVVQSRRLRWTVYAPLAAAAAIVLVFGALFLVSGGANESAEPAAQSLQREEQGTILPKESATTQPEVAFAASPSPLSTSLQSAASFPTDTPSPQPTAPAPIGQSQQQGQPSQPNSAGEAAGGAAPPSPLIQPNVATLLPVNPEITAEAFAQQYSPAETQAAGSAEVEGYLPPTATPESALQAIPNTPADALSAPGTETGGEMPEAPSDMQREQNGLLDENETAQDSAADIEESAEARDDEAQNDFSDSGDADTGSAMETDETGIAAEPPQSTAAGGRITDILRQFEVFIQRIRDFLKKFGGNLP